MRIPCSAMGKKPSSWPSEQINYRGVIKPFYGIRGPPPMLRPVNLKTPFGQSKKRFTWRKLKGENPSFKNSKPVSSFIKSDVLFMKNHENFRSHFLTERKGLGCAYRLVWT